MNEPDISEVDQIVARLGRGPDQVIPILQAIQAQYLYLPEAALRRVAEITDITPANITGVSTFYAQFRHQPMGQHLIKVCDGTACHVKGAEQVYDALREHLSIPANTDTDADGRYTVQKVFCVGCCTLAPVVQIDDVTFGHISVDTAPAMLRDFERIQAEAGANGKSPLEDLDGELEGEIRICLDSCCVARGCGGTHAALEAALRETGVAAKVKPVACVVMCERAPMLEIARPGQEPVAYAGVAIEDVKPIVLRHFKPRGFLRRLRTRLTSSLDQVLTDATWEPLERYASSLRDPPVAAFLGPQLHLATEHFAEAEPLDLDEYVARDGFKALERCLTRMSPDEVIEQVRASGLRGRGGAGFPTGVKWEKVRAAAGDPKYLLCNGDEGDPGAFMDRMLMESFPYRIIEGMAIAAYAVGAEKGTFYVRAEYPFAVERMRQALARCRERGYLGQRVLGADFNLDLDIFEGAGAFVCGEESAMLESIEGRRGIPRMRPPYPAERGLWQRPTLINNVETYALVPWILRHGPERFAALGTESSKGTKVFALAGKVVQGGLIEVPMGVTIRQIVEEIGGGIADGKQFKAVLIGGPSGGCVPEALADTPIDYESLGELGAIMGSGGLVVLDESDCLVDIARYFLTFCQHESCGKCTFCRIGTRRLLDILDRLCTGQGRPEDIDELEELCELVPRASLCGLGKTAPNPVITALRYFREEFEAHVEGRCPAGTCKDLITYHVTDRCIGCTLCAQHCPVDAIPMTPYQQHRIDAETCTRCDTCRQICPQDAIEIR